MPTDPENNFDALVVGLRLLLAGNKYSGHQIAKALFNALSPEGQVYAVLYGLENFTDVVQPVQIDVDDIIERINDNHYEADGDHAKLDDKMQREALRQRMHAEFTSTDAFSHTKWGLIDDLVEELKNDGWFKEIEPEKAGHNNQHD